jgi:DNA-binding MarR family transcriptional regulator
MSAVTPLTQPLDGDEEATIRALGRLILVLPRMMDADLVREQKLPLNEYMTLVSLSEAPERRMRMSELSAVNELSLSGMTRIVGRLEHEGLVERVRCEDDARGWFAVLTDAGFARLEQAYPTHLASVRRNVMDHFDGIDLARLARALERVGTPSQRDLRD